MGKRELIGLLNLSSWCLVMVEWLFLAVPWGFLRFVIVVFPEHTHLLFLRILGEDLASKNYLSPLPVASATVGSKALVLLCRFII